MENLYKNLTEKTFKKLAILFCLLGDILIFYYIWIDAFPRIFSQVTQQVKKNPALDSSMFPKNFFTELYELSRQAMLAMFIGVIIIHVINYLYYYRDKAFAYKYLRIQSSLGGLGLFLIGFSNLISGGINFAYTLSGVLMIYVFIGLSQFSPKTLEPKASSKKV
ncbi:hypothetical protein [Halobacteriovorax sp.]|uniref:hypothetical protein n=1 Tax=Halobacteriovorax sp. TaxID=2020862 RepID=UPI0035622036